MHPAIFFLGAVLLTLCLGSFLNVVIYRLPLIIFRNYQEDYEDFQEQIKKMNLPKGKFNLSYPPSHCPHCKAPITAGSNIPVLSFIFQRGKCKHCQAPISFRYPLVEILTAFLSVLTLWVLGPSVVGCVALLFVWTMIALTFIDLDHQILPDGLTLPLLWLGLLFNLGDFFVPIQSAVLGAILGYMSLFTVYWVFKALTGKEGMGFGDFKLLAAIGAWVGWQQLLVVILISALFGTVVGVSLILSKRLERGTPMPFGPFLALAGITSLLVGKPILHTYLKMMGF